MNGGEAGAACDSSKILVLLSSAVLKHTARTVQVLQCIYIMAMIYISLRVGLKLTIPDASL